MNKPFPLLDLSPELVGEVFQHCLPEQESFSPRDAPLVLTQVCSAWRAIALTTPRLWSNIYVPGWQTMPRDVGALVRLWLDRSGQTKLSVRVELFDQDIQVFPSDEETAKLRQLLCEVLSALTPHRQRIQRTRLVFPEELIPLIGVDDMINAKSLFLCGTLTDPLSAMEFGFDETVADEMETQNLSVVDIGPQRDSLTTLAIYGLPVKLEAIQKHTQLTHLELLDLHSSGALCQRTVFELLQRLSGLKSAVLDMSVFDRPHLIPPQERVVIENLEILFLTWTFPADVSALLDSIRTPNLEKFCLRGTPLVANDQPWKCLERFLTASRAPIKRISFGDFGSLDFCLLGCLKICEEVEQVTINHCVINDSVFEELATMGPRNVLIPKLRTFTMGVCDGFKARRFLEFARSRGTAEFTGVAKLEDLGIYYCTEITELDREGLATCGVENLVLETMDAEMMSPYARVMETHHELVAMLFQSE